MARVVVGVFPDRVSAEHAIVDLKDAGFDPKRMGFIMRDKQEAKEAAGETGVNVGTGAVTGGLLGGALGAILAATGTFVIPGIGPFVSAGILATAIAGGAAGAIVGGLVGLGIPKEEAEYYQSRVEQGSVLVTVDPDGREVEAREILLRNGAEDTWRTTPWSVQQAQAGAQGTAGPAYAAGSYSATAQQQVGQGAVGDDRVRINDQPMSSRDEVLSDAGQSSRGADLAPEQGMRQGMPPRTAPIMDRGIEQGRDPGFGGDMMPPTEADLTERDRAHAREGEQPLDTRDLPPERP